jgi:patatin-related protein
MEKQPGLVPIVPGRASAMTSASATSDEEEVRLAVVMYGGVSLAVYMNGVADELLRLVRATAAPAFGQPGFLLGGAQLRGSEAFYRKLAHENPERRLRRFVIDILSGTSAGGINAVYLAKALAAQSSLEQLRKVWIEEGDVHKLIRDQDSIAGVPELGPLRLPAPSLFNGDRMYRKLLGALDGMAGPAGKSVYVDELDLFVTATDLHGLKVQLSLSDGNTVSERQHRHVFNFRYDAVSERSDFERQDHPFIAFAARCTSSFPVAFEPVTLGAIAELADAAARVNAGSGSFRDNLETRWKRYFSGHLAGGEAVDELLRRPFADGGYLDNKPFECTIEAIERRDGQRPVTRKLIYVEPAPEQVADSAKRETPNFVQNVAAAFALPRVEGIRGDLERLLRQNRTFERLERITRDVLKDAEHGRAPLKFLPAREYATKYLDELIQERGAVYGGYHRLKVGAVTDDLARLVVRELEWNPDSDDFVAVWQTVRSWRKRKFKCYADDEGPATATETEFLLSYDLSFRTARLAFLIDQCRALVLGDASLIKRMKRMKFDVPAAKEEREAFVAKLAELRGGFSAINRELEAARHRLPAKARQKFPQLTGSIGAWLTAVKERKNLADTSVELEIPDREFRALDVFATDLAAEYRTLLRAARDRVNELLKLEETPAPAALTPQTRAKTMIRWLYEQYERYDVVAFPVLHGSPNAQSRRIEAFRISPVDAKRINESGIGKLGGAKFGNFGAFFDRLWRRNDALWGRLDACECLIRALYAGDPDQLGALIDAAQRAIVAESVPNDIAEDVAAFLLGKHAQRASDGASKAGADVAGTSQLAQAAREIAAELSAQDARYESLIAKLPGDATLLAAGIEPDVVIQYLKAQPAIGAPGNPEQLLRSAGRASVVLSSMVEGLTLEQPEKAKLAAKFLSQLSGLFLGVITLSLPGGLASAWWPRVAAVLTLAALLILVAGVFTSGPLFTLGLAAIGALAVIQLGKVIVLEYVAGRHSLVRAFCGVGALLVFALAIAGGIDLYGRARSVHDRFCAEGDNVLAGFCP